MLGEKGNIFSCKKVSPSHPALTYPIRGLLSRLNTTQHQQTEHETESLIHSTKSYFPSKCTCPFPAPFWIALIVVCLMRLLMNLRKVCCSCFTLAPCDLSSPDCVRTDAADHPEYKYFNVDQNALPSTMVSNQLSTSLKSELMGFFLDRNALNTSHYAPGYKGSTCWKPQSRCSVFWIISPLRYWFRLKASKRGEGCVCQE